MSDKNEKNKKINQDNYSMTNNIVVDLSLKCMKLSSILSVIFDINNNPNNKELIEYESLISLDEFKECAEKMIDIIKYLDNCFSKRFKTITETVNKNKEQKEN